MEDLGVPEEIKKRVKTTHEKTDLVYVQLPNNFIPGLEQSNSDQTFLMVDKYIKSTVTEQRNQQKVYNQFLESFLSLDNAPTAPEDPKKAFEKKMQSRKVISAKERRKKQLFEVPEDKRSYSLYLPLHVLWKQYISDVLGSSTGSALDAKLVKTDFHGAIIKVVKSKCPNLIGISGIIIIESENTFSIITQQNELKILPKANSIFNIQLDLVPPQIATIFGNNFCYRSYERSTKKYKHKASIEL